MEARKSLQRESCKRLLDRIKVLLACIGELLEEAQKGEIEMKYQIDIAQYGVAQSISSSAVCWLSCVLLLDELRRS